jgi:hypothetical protein
VNDSGPYRDYLRPRGLTPIKTTLRVTVAVQCLGAAAQLLSGGVSPVADFLIINVEWPQENAGQLDEIVGYVLVACGVVSLLRPTWAVLLPVTVWFIAVAAVPLIRTVSPASISEFLAHALRCLSPLGLLILDFWPPTLKSHLGRTIVGMWILRVATAAAFAGLGMLAVLDSVTSGPALELVEAIADHAIDVNLSESAARSCLGVIGGIHLAFAINVFFTHSKPILVCLAVWGFLFAFAQMVRLGVAGYPESLVSFADGGVPIVLWLYYSLSMKEYPPEVVAEN